jgi:hypothetical protein
MPELLPEINLAERPDRIVMLVDEESDTEELASFAVEVARSRMPKVTGAMAKSLQSIYGDNYFGIYFPDRKTWFLEQGIKPFTMNALQGKTIPMWIDDPMGSERKANPKAERRRTADGREQVLIFRRVGKKGERKRVIRRGKDGLPRPTTVPVSYPGAPGRITRREMGPPLGRAGKVAGQIAKGNVGVRWRHPGIVARQFLNSAMAQTAIEFGIESAQVYLTDNASFFSLIRS